jgi:hypothetical protein
MRTAAHFAFVIGLAACGAAQALLPPDAVILPAPIADQMLHQCSRGVPAGYDGHWLPGAGEIAALEAALPAALAADHPGDAALRDAPRGWRRQYGGFLRGGHRFVYGNFFPREVGEGRSPDNDWHRAPVMVCDGGHAFFGVEFDVDGRRFTRLDFNGFA